MKNRLLAILTMSFVITSFVMSAQLSDAVLKQNSEVQAQRLQQYFNFSNQRRAKVEEVFLSHEKAKGELIHQSLSDLTESLEKERIKFFEELSALLTQNEIDLYDQILISDYKNERDHLRTLVRGFEMDTSYINDYVMFQSEEVLPLLMHFRSELEQVIKREDKKKLDLIRNDVFDMFDDCLVICLSHADGSEHEYVASSNSDLIVDINKELNIKDSNINELLSLAKKYESEIHQIRIRNRVVFKKWHKKASQIRNDHILPNHRESFNKLVSKNDIASLRHIESDVILLLLDPADERRSRYFLNFGIHSQI